MSERDFERAFRARSCLPVGVVAACMPIDDHSADLFAAEAAYVARAVPKRKREFATGRACARSALAELGVERCPIPVGSTREPVWPPGICGSITHDGCYSVAAAAPKAAVPLLGIDLARNDALSKELVGMICTEAEIADLADRFAAKTAYDAYKLAFSIKESVYKCLFPLVGRMFDFLDVRLHMEPERGTAAVELLNRAIFAGVSARIEARFCVIEDYLFSAAWGHGTSTADARAEQRRLHASAVSVARPAPRPQDSPR